MKKLPLNRSFRILADEKLTPWVHKLLKAQGYNYEPEPFSPYCFKLISEPAPLGSSLAAFLGYIYIQDRSSMLPPLALKPELGEAVLDFCASPGSKSSFLAQLTGSSGLVIANEPQPDRFLTLRQNLIRLNLPQVTPLKSQGQALSQLSNFKTIALDPPCSGWGTIDKHPLVKTLWREEKTKPLISLQRELLSCAAKLLPLKGKLLYSTCTTNDLENEAQVEFALEKLGLSLEPLDLFPGFVFEEPKIKGTLKVNSQDSKAQGFFLALLRKTSLDTNLGPEEPCELRGDPFLKENLEHPCLDFNKLPPGELRLEGWQIYFYPKLLIPKLTKNLKFQGFPLGAWKKGHFIPEPRLRFLAHDQPSPSCQVFEELKDILALFSGQSLKVNLKTKNTLMWWQGLPLGFAKIQQGRLMAQFK
ncbi:MAG: RsmB/NOP family class I SAM-dependent RNA methyltransferase [Desulfovibrionaceae bacterium]|nr:RsmB/NOP family class I SAM-dependent RNA methyltransferase [Desulfovibrionaceae bacterium]